MGLLFTLLGIAAILFAISLVSNGLAYLFTEVWPLPIKRKPFSCYGCLAFWLTFIFGTVLAFVVRRYFDAMETRNVVTYGVIGLAFTLGLINYLIVKIKYKVYE